MLVCWSMIFGPFWKVSHQRRGGHGSRYLRLFPATSVLKDLSLKTFIMFSTRWCVITRLCCTRLLVEKLDKAECAPSQLCTALPLRKTWYTNWIIIIFKGFFCCLFYVWYQTNKLEYCVMQICHWGCLCCGSDCINIFHYKHIEQHYFELASYTDSKWSTIWLISSEAG